MPLPSPQTLLCGTMAAEPVSPSRTGFVFDGWYASPDFSGSAWDFSIDTVTNDMVLFARWTQALFTVTFDSNGGIPIPAPQMVSYGGMAISPIDPAKYGYAFAGWYASHDLSGDPWDFYSDRVMGDTVLYAGWEDAVFTVTFDSNGGIPIPDPQLVPYGETVIMPPEPVKEGSYFLGWYSAPDPSGEPWDFENDVVTGDTALYARWTTEAYYVAFVANGGVPVPPFQLIPNGGKASRPLDPTRGGYIFGGWYIQWDLSGVPWDFYTDTVVQNTILYARWDLLV